MQNASQTILSDGYMPRPPLSLPEYRAAIGSEIGRSDWIAIDQPMIDGFAALTGDNQYIHIDPVRAGKTPLGGTVAHGFLTLAIIGGLAPKVIPPIEGTGIGYNYGFNRVRLMAPVPSGSRIRAVFVMKGAEQRAPGRVTLTFAVTVEIEGRSKPALVAEWLTLMASE
jgi:acyl dehydratase